MDKNGSRLNLVGKKNNLFFLRARAMHKVLITRCITELDITNGDDPIFNDGKEPDDEMPELESWNDDDYSRDCEADEV